MSLNLYDVFCGVLYILREGRRWRTLPHDCPKRNNAYNHYRIWHEKDAGGKSALDKVLDELALSARVMDGRLTEPARAALGSKNVKNALAAEEKGCDAGEKYPERKYASALKV